MTQIIDNLSRLVTARPWITLSVLVIITVALGAGAVQRALPPDTAEMLPREAPSPKRCMKSMSSSATPARSAL